MQLYELHDHWVFSATPSRLIGDFFFFYQREEQMSADDNDAGISAGIQSQVLRDG